MTTDTRTEYDWETLKDGIITYINNLAETKSEDDDIFHTIYNRIDKTYPDDTEEAITGLISQVNNCDIRNAKLLFYAFPNAIPPNLLHKKITCGMDGEDGDWVIYAEENNGGASFRQFSTYEEIITKGLWLEDRGDYSRYTTDEEESIWVNNAEETIADPDEDADNLDDEEDNDGITQR